MKKQMLKMTTIFCAITLCIAEAGSGFMPERVAPQRSRLTAKFSPEEVNHRVRKQKRFRARKAVSRTPDFEVPTLEELLRRHFRGKEKIFGVDFGAGSGIETEKVKTVLDSLFTKVSLFGMEYNLNRLAADDAGPRGDKLIAYFDVSILLKGPLARHPDLVTILTPVPETLELFIRAAKRVVAADGLIVLNLGIADKEDLEKGSPLFGQISPDEFWERVKDFRYVRFSGDEWTTINMHANPEVFIFSPNGYNNLTRPSDALPLNVLQSA